MQFAGKTPPDYSLEEKYQVYLSWENYLWFNKSHKAFFLGSDESFCFISICMFSNFKNTLETTTSLSELCFRHTWFILFVVISRFLWTMKVTQAPETWKPWRLIMLDMRLYIYIYINININKYIYKFIYIYKFKHGHTHKNQQQKKHGDWNIEITLPRKIS